MTADQYEIQFNTHANIFVPDAVDEVDRGINRFITRRAGRSIDPITIPANIGLVIKEVQVIQVRNPQVTIIFRTRPLRTFFPLTIPISQILLMVFFDFGIFPLFWKHSNIMLIRKPEEYPVLVEALNQ